MKIHYQMGGHIAATWWIWLNRLSVAAMRLMSNYFDCLYSFINLILLSNLPVQQCI